MSYTNKGAQPQGVPLNFTNKIREAMIAELVAINGYAEHIANSNIEEINKVWEEIMGDEKKHYGMFLTLLQKYDSVEYHNYIAMKDLKLENTTLNQTYKPEYDKQLILNNVREAIKGELEAIILYEQHLVQISAKDAKEVFRSIANEEKEHTETLTRVLLKFDKAKYDSLT